jgi:drug/metabolite transporter (DMT)-like permease
MSMPGLPASLVGVLLLVQPAGSLALSAVFLGERPSWLQLVGVAVILAGVLIAASGAGRNTRRGGREGQPDAASQTVSQPVPDVGS